MSAAAQTCSSCTAAQLQCRFWPARFSCSRGVGTGHGLGHQELPTGPASSVAALTRLSRSSMPLPPSRNLPLSLLDPLRPLRQPPRLFVPRSLRPTPTTNGTLSLTHTASPHLSVAPRPPSPSRLTPLELVGVLATSVAAVSARPPSALCGGTFNLLLLSLRVPPVWRGYDWWVRSWACACFRGSCRFAGPCSLLLRPLGLRALRGVTGAGPGVAFCSTSLETLRSPMCVAQLPWHVFARKGSSWWPPSLAKRLHRCRICCSWTSLVLLMGVETAGGVMTKFTECNTTILTASNPDVLDVCCQPVGSPHPRMCSPTLCRSQ